MSRSAAFAFALCVLCFYPPVAAATSMSSTSTAELIGTWQVAHVHIDSRATRSRQYEEGDERLVGRLFTFAPTAISTNIPDAAHSCLVPVMTSQTITAGMLFRNSFAGRLTGPEYVLPADFNIHVQPSRNVNVVSVKCGNNVWNPGVGADNGVLGSWLILQSRDSAIMHWYDDVLLVLNRVRGDAIPSRPSHALRREC